jgi:MarR family transcriptional regulator, organic hydroperoxide resistance regulator
MKGETVIDKRDELWLLWERTSHAIRRAREIELRQRAGLSAIEAGVLYFTKTSKGPVTPSVLARLLHREPHTVSGLVTRMEKRGLVQRKKNLEKKNLVRVVVTKKGEEALKKQEEVTIARNILSTSLTEKERDSLKAYLNKLYNMAIELIRESQPLPYQ